MFLLAESLGSEPFWIQCIMGFTFGMMGVGITIMCIFGVIELIDKLRERKKKG